MFCRYCGKPIADNAKFCGCCGNPVWDDVQQQPPVQQEPMQQEPMQQPPMQQPLMQQPQGFQPNYEPQYTQYTGEAPYMAGTTAGAASTAATTATGAVNAASGVANVAAGVASAGVVAAKAGVKVVHHGRRVAMVFLILAIILGGFSAYLRFFVSGPEDTVNEFFDAYNNSDFKGMVECMDPTYQRQFSALSDLSGDLLGSLTGADIDFGALMDISPSLFEAEGMLPDATLESVEITYSGGKLEEFTNEYHVDIVGIEKVLASSATATIKYSINGKSYSDSLPMKKCGWGDWRISMSELFNDLMKQINQ